jgi:hypothetical protein
MCTAVSRPAATARHRHQTAVRRPRHAQTADRRRSRCCAAGGWGLGARRRRAPPLGAVEQQVASAWLHSGHQPQLTTTTDHTTSHQCGPVASGHDQAPGTGTDTNHQAPQTPDTRGTWHALWRCGTRHQRPEAPARNAQRATANGQCPAAQQATTPGVVLSV